LTTFGRTRILSTIIKQIFTEQETEMKWYFDSIEEIVGSFKNIERTGTKVSYPIYCVVVIDRD